MARIVIESSQKIKSINIVFDGDGTEDLTVSEEPTVSNAPREETPSKSNGLYGGYEIEESDFEELDDIVHQPVDSNNSKRDTRPTVGESFDNVSFEVPELSTSIPSPIVVPEVEDRPQKVDMGMGEEL